MAEVDAVIWSTIFLTTKQGNHDDVTLIREARAELMNFTKEHC